MIVTAANPETNAHIIQGKFRNFVITSSKGAARKKNGCILFSKGEQIRMTRPEAANAIRYARAK